MNFNFNFPRPDWLQLLAVIYAGIFGLAWFILSFGVWLDAIRLVEKGYSLRFVGHFWWFLIVLGFSVPAAALYWAAHHSAFATIEKRDEDEAVT